MACASPAPRLRPRSRVSTSRLRRGNHLLLSDHGRGPRHRDLRVPDRWSLPVRGRLFSELRQRHHQPPDRHHDTGRRADWCSATPDPPARWSARATVQPMPVAGGRWLNRPPERSCPWPPVRIRRERPGASLAADQIVPQARVVSSRLSVPAVARAYGRDAARSSGAARLAWPSAQAAASVMRPWR